MSISFMSPRDVIFTNINAAKNRLSSNEKSPNAHISMIPNDLQVNRGEFEASQYANNITNDDFSMDPNINGID